MYNVPKDVQRWVLLPRRRNDSDWRRDGWRLPHRSLQHRRRYHLYDICVHAVPRGDLRLRDHAGDGVVLGDVHSRLLLSSRLGVRKRRNQRWHVYNVPKDVQRGVLLPRERDDRNWRRDGWRLPDWSVQHR